MSAQRATGGDAATIAAIALDEYTRRLANAKRLVAERRVSAAAAEHEMRAWSAIAVLCAAPGVRELDLADYRETIVHYPGNGAPAVYGHKLSEAEARCDLARDLCGPNTWGPILAKARDVALSKADTPDRIERAQNLCLLARALDVPLTAASCARPRAAQPERKAA